MPLKILIALAMVNKSPVATYRRSPNGVGTHICCAAGTCQCLCVGYTGYIQTFKPSTELTELEEYSLSRITLVKSFTTHWIMQISTKLDVLTCSVRELHGQNEKQLFTNNPDGFFWQTNEFCCHYVSAQVFVD